MRMHEMGFNWRGPGHVSLMTFPTRNQSPTGAKRFDCHDKIVMGTVIEINVCADTRKQGDNRVIGQQHMSRKRVIYVQ